MIQAHGLTKRYGQRVAVDDLTVTVHPGRVTGFLGPNGAGKTTTMRMILGLAAPTAGTVTVNGRHYTDLPAPLRHVGALLDATAVHPSRTALTTCSRWPTATTSPAEGSRRSWPWSGWRRWAAGRPVLPRHEPAAGIAAALLGDPHRHQPQRLPPGPGRYRPGGVLIVTSEYATGTIQASLAAVARRGRLLAAKATMATIVALTVGELAGFGMFFTGQAALAAQGGPHTSLDQPHVLRAVVGAGLYLAVVALLGVAVGTLIRSTAAALATMVSVTLLIPAMSGLLPASWARLVGKFWPTVAGSQVMAVHHDPASALGPWAGFGLLCAFAAVVLTAALVAFRYRDA